MISQVIKKRRAELDITLAEVARLVGVSEATVQRWESGVIKNIRQDKISKLAAALGVSPAYLLCWEENKDCETKGVKIPILGNVAAGVPIEAIEDIIDYEEISQEIAKTGQFFALLIRGDSMEPKFSQGDVVIVRKQPQVENGQIAIVLINEQEATCKKFIRHEHGISLISLNPAYAPMFYTYKEVEEMPITIIGHVVELRAKF
ncbi:MAG: LexA family protein [Bacillota bacterium]|jgi:repressor LexA